MRLKNRECTFELLVFQPFAVATLIPLKTETWSKNVRLLAAESLTSAVLVTSSMAASIGTVKLTDHGVREFSQNVFVSANNAAYEVILC